MIKINVTMIQISNIIYNIYNSIMLYKINTFSFLTWTDNIYVSGQPRGQESKLKYSK